MSVSAGFSEGLQSSFIRTSCGWNNNNNNNNGEMGCAFKWDLKSPYLFSKKKMACNR